MERTEREEEFLVRWADPVEVGVRESWVKAADLRCPELVEQFFMRQLPLRAREELESLRTAAAAAAEAEVAAEAATAAAQ